MSNCMVLYYNAQHQRFFIFSIFAQHFVLSLQTVLNHSPDVCSVLKIKSQPFARPQPLTSLDCSSVHQIKPDLAPQTRTEIILHQSNSTQLVCRHVEIWGGGCQLKKY